MKKIGLILAGFAAAAILAIGGFSTSTNAESLIQQGVKSTGAQNQGPDNLQTDVVPTIINVMLFIVGVLSVIMIIYSGIRYVISAGNSSVVTSAKNTLTYSIVGLIVAMLAYAIVNWVVFAAQN